MPRQKLGVGSCDSDGRWGSCGGKPKRRKVTATAAAGVVAVVEAEVGSATATAAAGVVR